MARLPGESWESYADRRIRQAQADGEFDRLPGFGQPIPGIDEPWDENSWVRQKLRREQINELPPVLAARLDKERVLESLSKLAAEAEVRTKLLELNRRIQQAHFSTADGPAIGITPVDVDEEVRRWNDSRAT